MQVLTHVFYQSKQFTHTKHQRRSDKIARTCAPCFNFTTAQPCTSCCFLTTKPLCNLCNPTGVNVILRSQKLIGKKIPTQLKAEMQTEGNVQVNLLNIDFWPRIIQSYKAIQNVRFYLPGLHFHLGSLEHASKQNVDVPCTVNGK